MEWNDRRHTIPCMHAVPYFLQFKYFWRRFWVDSPKFLSFGLVSEITAVILLLVSKITAVILCNRGSVVDVTEKVDIGAFVAIK